MRGALEGDGTRSALNSRDVNSSHSSDRAKCGALLCRAARDTASATRSCAPCIRNHYAAARLRAGKKMTILRIVRLFT